ncbi:glycoside hydrolase family 29 protein [Marasmius fiardii PR-910]|nr:glycoside hydrolase family 29 protein [Marasmius fiardii PR-910]
MLPHLLGLLAVATATSAAAATLQPFPITGIVLDSLLNNNAASPDGSANFDGLGGSYDSQFLPTGPFTYDGITYNLPSSWGSGKNDNVISMTQVIPLGKPTFVHEIHFLFITDSNGDGVSASQSTLNWADGTSEVLELQTRNWWSWPIINPGAIQTPYNFINNGAGKNWNGSHIHQWSTALTSERQLSSITLPNIHPGRRLHFFAIAYSPSADSSNSTGPALSIRRVRFTNRWESVGHRRAQAVEVTVANLLPTSALSANNSLNSRHTVEVSGPGIKTLTPGVVNRLVPGDQVRVDVLVTGVQDGTNASVEIKDANGRRLGISDGWAASALIENWTADTNTLMKHETPTWWNNAKYGIFIHWGVYSVPAWSPPNSYAEWYNWWLHEDPHNTSNPTFKHHLETFGENVVYDNFIANFTASKWNASEWLDLFDRAGAKYFVLVTKHHDGYALFDTGNSTHRSSFYTGPKRDFVAELFETAAKKKPNIHRGTYYSLPEWFNPDYSKYGFSNWPGGLAHNVFNLSELEPYTGKLDISDYLTDIQLPHMLQLANQYGTEIMWCDIGGPNKTLEFAAQFYTEAFKNGRQVTINNRCGAVPDYFTPEYSTFNAIQTGAWESSAGMDPFSYGYNSATNASQYKNGTTLVRTLIDIVSKGGNFLIDVGPTAEGEIIAPMANNLLDAGSWLQHSGECIYDTNYWFQGSQETNLAPGVNAARFTRTADTFCIMVFDPPNGQLVINKRLPLLPGDEIRFLSTTAGHSLPWSMDASTGKVTVDVSASASAISKVQFGWAFQVKFKLEA